MNAVIYARYSSHNQTEQSIEGQISGNYYLETSDQRKEVERIEKI